MKYIIFYIVALSIACAATIHVAIEDYRWQKHHASEVQSLKLGAER